MRDRVEAVLVPDIGEVVVLAALFAALLGFGPPVDVEHQQPVRRERVPNGLEVGAQFVALAKDEVGEVERDDDVVFLRRGFENIGLDDLETALLFGPQLRDVMGAAPRQGLRVEVDRRRGVARVFDATQALANAAVPQKSSRRLRGGRL